MDEGVFQYVRKQFEGTFDVKFRSIDYGCGTVTLIFIDNMCDSKFISDFIVTPLVEIEEPVDDIECIRKKVLRANLVDYVKDKKDAVAHILSGDVVLTFSEFPEALFCEAKGYSKRGVTVPQTEAVLKGPREGFTETFVDNISMIRRKVKSPDLKFEQIVVGQKSNTVVVIVYIKGVTPDHVLNLIRNTILRCKNEFILDTNYIEEQLGGKKSPFDTVGHSEKPDVVAAKIMEGRVGVLVDGAPFGVTVPFFFLENFQMPDDYYLNKYYANATRYLRWAAFLISTFLPGLYVALITYHFPLIPSVFVFRLAVSRAGVPFPTVVEVFLMTVFFQIIKEAGLRLPQPIGQAMSIVGALILGDAATGAGLTSQSTVMIVALASICYFLIPKLYGASALWGLVVLFFASALGLPGFYIGFFMCITHIASLKTCGYPFMYPMGTLHMMKYRDTARRGNLDDISNNIFDEDDSK